MFTFVYIFLVAIIIYIGIMPLSIRKDKKNGNK